VHPVVEPLLEVVPEQLTYYVIVPLAVAALLTGVAQAAGTPGVCCATTGVINKLLLTIGATTALLVSFVPTVGRVAGAAETAGPELLGMRDLSYVEHAAFGLVFLLIAAVLAMCSRAEPPTTGCVTNAHNGTSRLPAATIGRHPRRKASHSSPGVSREHGSGRVHCAAAVLMSQPPRLVDEQPLPAPGVAPAQPTAASQHGEHEPDAAGRAHARSCRHRLFSPTSPCCPWFDSRQPASHGGLEPNSGTFGTRSD
jgi:hypothetical protein